MTKWKEVRFDFMGIKYGNGLPKESPLSIYLITNEDSTKTLCVALDELSIEFPFDDILNCCLQKQCNITYH